MIIGIARLPDVSLSKPYNNTMFTEFGVSGRAIMPAALAFYKIIVQHGEYILEYVVATSQEFGIPFTGFKERVTGLISNDISLVNMAPISVKIINQTSRVCDSYLFTEPITYLLLFGGNFEPLSGTGVVEFSKYPSYMSAINNQHLTPMANDDFCNTISLAALISNIPGNYVIPDNVPTELHAANISQAMRALTSQAPAAITVAATPNDPIILNWIFGMLSTSIQAMDCNFSDYISIVADLYETITKIAPSEPLCHACLTTPSIIRLTSILPYINMSQASMYYSMSRSYAPYSDNMCILDRSNNMFDILDCTTLLHSIAYASITDMRVTITRGGRLVVNHAETWAGPAEQCHYGSIETALKQAYARVYSTLCTDDIELIFVKNWLDEVWITITTTGQPTDFYIPTWYYNLSSPMAINATLSSGICAKYGKRMLNDRL